MTNKVVTNNIKWFIWSGVFLENAPDVDILMDDYLPRVNRINMGELEHSWVEFMAWNYSLKQSNLRQICNAIQIHYISLE